MKVGIVLCNLCRVVKWPACSFCTKMWVKAMLYLTVDGGRREAENMRYTGAALTVVIELLNE